MAGKGDALDLHHPVLQADRLSHLLIEGDQLSRVFPQQPVQRGETAHAPGHAGPQDQTQAYSRQDRSSSPPRPLRRPGPDPGLQAGQLRRDGPVGLLFPHSLVFLHALHLQTPSLNSSFNSFSAFFSRVWTVLLGIRSSSAVSRKVQSKK